MINSKDRKLRTISARTFLLHCVHFKSSSNKKPFKTLYLWSCPKCNVKRRADSSVGWHILCTTSPVPLLSHQSQNSITLWMNATKTVSGHQVTSSGSGCSRRSQSKTTKRSQVHLYVLSDTSSKTLKSICSQTVLNFTSSRDKFLHWKLFTIKDSLTVWLQRRDTFGKQRF